MQFIACNFFHATCCNTCRLSDVLQRLQLLQNVEIARKKLHTKPRLKLASVSSQRTLKYCYHQLSILTAYGHLLHNTLSDSEVISSFHIHSSCFAATMMVVRFDIDFPVS